MTRWTWMPIVLLLVAFALAACRSSSVEAGEAAPAMNEGAVGTPAAHDESLVQPECTPEKRALLLKAVELFDAEPERAREALRQVGNHYAHALLALRAWIDGDAGAARDFLGRTSAGSRTEPSVDAIALALRLELEAMDCTEPEADAIFDYFALVPCALFRELPGKIVTQEFIGYMGSSRDDAAFRRKRACFESYLAAELDHGTAEAVGKALSNLRNDVMNVCRFQSGFCGTMFVSAMAVGRENVAIDLFFDPDRNLPPTAEEARRRAEAASSSLGVRGRLKRFERAVAGHGVVLGNALCGTAKARKNALTPARCEELGQRAARSTLADVLAAYRWAADEGVCSKIAGQPFCAGTSGGAGPLK